jgi:hypothetical protein
MKGSGTPRERSIFVALRPKASENQHTIFPWIGSFNILKLFISEKIWLQTSDSWHEGLPSQQPEKRQPPLAWESKQRLSHPGSGF